MLWLLFWVAVLGIAAWVWSRIPVPEPFKTVGYAILVIILLYMLFTTLAGASPHFGRIP